MIKLFEVYFYLPLKGSQLDAVKCEKRHVKMMTAQTATLTPNNMLVRGLNLFFPPLVFCRDSFHSWYSFHSCHKGSLFTREMILDPSRQLGRVGARHAHAYCVIIDVISLGSSIIYLYKCFAFEFTSNLL